MNFLAVFLGGGIGAACRYALSLVLVKSQFPLMTFAANVLGCLAIGIVTGMNLRRPMEKNLILFLKTGFCGGFTTFSTFSLEAVTLFQNRSFLLAGLYVFASLALCILGVIIGTRLAR